MRSSAGKRQSVHDSNIYADLTNYNMLYMKTPLEMRKPANKLPTFKANAISSPASPKDHSFWKTNNFQDSRKNSQHEQQNQRNSVSPQILSIRNTCYGDNRKTRKYHLQMQMFNEQIMDHSNLVSFRNKKREQSYDEQLLSPNSQKRKVFRSSFNQTRTHSRVIEDSKTIQSIKEDTLNKTSFRFLFVLGKGGFGKVWKVEYLKTRKMYAMKEMSKAKVLSKKSVNSVMNERVLLSSLSHSFIANIHFAFQDRDNLYLVMDLLTGGDLRYHIGRQRRFSEAQTKFLLACMIISIDYIHHSNIIHRDIKPENIVLDRKGYPRLTDFGIARIVKAENSQETSGTPGYMGNIVQYLAPEVMCRQNHSYGVDHYALGIMGYEFMMGRRPYLGKSRKEIRDAILSKQVQIKRQEIPVSWSFEAADFVNALIQRKPTQRLGYNGSEELFKHPWFSGFQWKAIEEKSFPSPFLVVVFKVQMQSQNKKIKTSSEKSLLIMILRMRSFKKMSWNSGKNLYRPYLVLTHSMIEWVRKQEVLMPLFNSKLVTKVKKVNEYYTFFILFQFMNKKQKQKEAKLKDKKLKDAQRSNILNALQEHQLSEQQMNLMNSIKNSNSSKAAIKEKRKHSKAITEESVEDIAPQIVNIFSQDYQSQNPVNIVQEQKESKLSEWERLEIEAKKYLPDLNLQSFDSKPVPKHQKHMVKYDKVEEEQIDLLTDDIYDLDKNLFIQDDLLKPMQMINYQIDRNETIQKQRSQLPILLQEQEIIDTIKSNLITLVSGETGCGKSTQIPQFLYEAGFCDYGHIAVTQPRRLAAIALAQRVSEETNFELGQQICYQVKHQSSGVSDKMKIKFMTDGILLNEMQSNALLPQYSVVIIDEAHERKINIDLLIGLLSRIVIIRAKFQLQPLRLIIMSATMRLDDFLLNKHVFPRQLSLIKIQTRQYPVQVYFSKTTKPDYLQAAIDKCLKVHRTLPPGDILIFLTGQQEIKQCCHLLSDQLEQLRYPDSEQVTEVKEQKPIEESSDEEIIAEEDVFNKEQYIDLKNLTNHQVSMNAHGNVREFIVYPLYSKLEEQEQNVIFNNDPLRRRMIVISTNVAETSVTIPSIRYVIDSGKQKRKIIDDRIGLEKHEISWISQASSAQRSGRAGRTGPGYCYRLYSTAVFTKLTEFDAPEITQVPLDSVILQMKNIGVKDVRKFPFLTTPKITDLKLAESNLNILGAIKNNVITELGKVLVTMPLAPKYAKLLLEARAQSVFQYGLILVCLLSIDELIDKSAFAVSHQKQTNEIEDEIQQYQQLQKDLSIRANEQKQQFKSLRDHLNRFGNGQQASDVITLINIIGQMISQLNDSEDLNYQISKFALSNKLISKSLKEVYYNILQLFEIFNVIVEDKKEILHTIQSLKQYQYPNATQVTILSNLIIRSNGLAKICRLQRKMDADSKTMKQYYCSREGSEVSIHSSSLFYGKSSPEFVSYQGLLDLSGKQYMTNVTKISDMEVLYALDPRSDIDKKLQINKDQIFYDAARDIVKCQANAVIDNWPVENIFLPYPKDQLGFYSSFARLLLKGDIIDFFKVLSKYYKYKVAEIRESNMQQYSQSIIKAMMINGISNKSKLLAIWKNNQQFLLKEVLSLVDNSYHELIKSKWPPL